MKKYMWMVRAGEGAVIFNDFKEKSVIAIGWKALGDLSEVKTRASIKKLVQNAYQEAKPGWIVVSAGQVSRFRLDFEPVQLVITYNSEERKYLIGKLSED